MVNFCFGPICYLTYYRNYLILGSIAYMVNFLWTKPWTIYPICIVITSCFLLDSHANNCKSCIRATNEGGDRITSLPYLRYIRHRQHVCKIMSVDRKEAKGKKTMGWWDRGIEWNRIGTTRICATSHVAPPKTALTVNLINIRCHNQPVLKESRTQTET